MNLHAKLLASALFDSALSSVVIQVEAYSHSSVCLVTVGDFAVWPWCLAAAFGAFQMFASFDSLLRNHLPLCISRTPPALYYPNCNACSTFGKHNRRASGLWTSIRSSDPPCPPQAAELSLLRILPPKLQQPWGPKVVPLVNQSRKRPQVALPKNRSRKIDGLAGSPPCMGCCNIFHSGCNLTTTITGGTHSTL